MLRLTAGQAHDNPQLAPLVAAYTAAHGRRFRLLADKGYAHDPTRNYLRKHRIAHMIPERSDQIARRKARGTRGGRPPALIP
jgi:transposase